MKYWNNLCFQLEITVLLKCNIFVDQLQIRQNITFQSKKKGNKTFTQINPIVAVKSFRIIAKLTTIKERKCNSQPSTRQIKNTAQKLHRINTSTDIINRRTQTYSTTCTEEQIIAQVFHRYIVIYKQLN